MARRKKDNPRQVHEAIVGAWHRGETKRAGGRRYFTDGTSLWVWGNLVAKKEPEGIFITDAGYQTLLTKNVLNTVLDLIGAGHISQSDFTWLLSTPQGGMKWGGSALITKSGKVISSSTNPRRKRLYRVVAYRPGHPPATMATFIRPKKHAREMAEIYRAIAKKERRRTTRYEVRSVKNKRGRRHRMNLHTEGERQKVREIVMRWYRKGMQAAAAHNRSQTAQAYGILQGIKLVADAETRSRAVASILDLVHSAMGQIERRWKGIRA